MTTLWQRLGRAARDRSTQGLALVFVEAKYFDEEREKAEGRKRHRREQALKRKGKMSSIHPPPLKRARVFSRQSITPLSPSGRSNAPDVDPQSANADLTFIAASVRESGTLVESEIRDLQHDVELAVDIAQIDEDEDLSSGGEDSDEDLEVTHHEDEAQPEEISHVQDEATTEELWESRRHLYQEHAREKMAASRAVVKRQNQDLDPELMDFVNAEHRGLGCRRKPIKIFFSSDKACKYLLVDYVIHER